MSAQGIQQAQIDVTGSAPDDNGIEGADCPFHSGAPGTLMLDHLRGAFICFSCRGMGVMAIQVAAGRRIAVLTLRSFRAAMKSAMPTPLALGGMTPNAAQNIIYLPNPEKLSRASIHNAAVLLPGVPSMLMCSPNDLALDVRAWLAVRWPQLCIVFVPDPILRNNGWALLSHKGAVVSARQIV